MASYLRIKQRKSKQKWCVRYLTKGTAQKKYYLLTLQVQSRTLDGAVPKMRKAFIIHGFTEADGATLIHNNNHL